MPMVPQVWAGMSEFGHKFQTQMLDFLRQLSQTFIGQIGLKLEVWLVG